MKYKVTKGKTLKQYNDKYKTLKHVLVSLSKKEVDEFDKKHNSKDSSLLNHKNWWLIDGTYYEIPKPIRWVWFRNLSKKIQVATYVVLAGVVATTTVLTYHFIKLTKMVNEADWRTALDAITETSIDRNFTFTAEFDSSYQASNDSEMERIKEKVYVVNNEEHVIRTITKGNKELGTSELCYKLVNSNEYYIKEKTNGIWSDYKLDIRVYNLPSSELKELSMFKIMYSDFKFNGNAYTYTQKATETNPYYYIINLKFKHKKLVSATTQQDERKDYRKFEFYNYGKTSLNV